MSDVRVPPHNLELEMNVLGAMMLSRKAIIAVSDILDAQSFYRGKHRHIFESIMWLYNDGKPVDLVTLSSFLDRVGKLEECGGMAYLADIASAAGSSVNAATHAEMLAELSTRRKTIALGEQMVKDSYEGAQDTFAMLADYNAEMFNLISKRKAEYQQIGTDIDKAWEELERESQGRIIGVPTGWPAMDKFVHFRAGSLSTIAGESGHGKSVFLANIACNAAKRGIPVAIFSLEMTIDEYQARMIKHLARTAVKFGGNLDEPAWRRLKVAKESLAKLPIYFDGTTGISPEVFRARCQKMAYEHQVGLVVVDYLQLMRVPGNEPLRIKIGMCTGMMKQVAKELNIPVVTASQFRKKGQDGTTRRTADDLAESKSIETDSDVIIILKSGEQSESQRKMREQNVEAWIVKQRNGVDDFRLKMFWYKAHMTFDCIEDLKSASQAEAAYHGEPRDRREYDDDDESPF